MTAGNGKDRYWRSETRPRMMVVTLSNSSTWTPHPPRHELHHISKSFGHRTHLNYCHLRLQSVFSNVSILLLYSSLARVSWPSSNSSRIQHLLCRTVTSSRSSRSSLQEVEKKLSEQRKPCLLHQN